MNKNLLVSVIVPVYNAEKYLANCIESILNQSYEQLELILINDGSTDNSLIIIRKYQNDIRVKLYTILNNGVSYARNLGIEKANGNYIMFVDSDDYLDKYALEHSIKQIQNDKADILFFCWYKIKNNKKTKVTVLENNSSNLSDNNISWLKKRSIGPDNNQLREFIPIDLYNTPWAKLYNAKILKDSKVIFKPRNIVGMEDVLFNIEIFQQIKAVTFLNKYFYYYRVDSESSLTKIDVDNLDSKLKNLIKEVEINIRQEGLNEVLTNRIRFSMINIITSITSKHRNTNFWCKYREVKKVINDPFYQQSFIQDFSNAAIRTKIFFLLCKWRQVFLLTLILSLTSKFK